MPVTLARLLAALAVLLLSATAAQAQQPVPPEHYTLDPRGVDLVNGTFNYATTEVVIGPPGGGGLAYGRVWLGAGRGWRDINIGTINANSLGTVFTVSVGGESEIFDLVNNVFQPRSPRGATLTRNNQEYTFTSADGAVAVLERGFVGRETPYEANEALMTRLSMPNGEQLIYHFLKVTRCPVGIDPCPVQMEPIGRLQSVTNNRGYQLYYTYYSNVADGQLLDLWLQVESVHGLNNTVESCPPESDVCQPSAQWPRIVYDGIPATLATDELNRTTTYAYDTAGNLTGITAPDSTVTDLAVQYDPNTGRVSAATDASGGWSYSFTDPTTTTRTTVATGPANQLLAVQSDLSIGRATAVTDAENRTWQFSYHQGRLQRQTNPEFDYVEVVYDARGNVIQTTAAPRPNMGQPIVTTADYPDDCLPPVTAATCNRPLSTTDGRNNTTDYEWSNSHGGLLSVTRPAPASGADRPRTRYTYQAFAGRNLSLAGALSLGQPDVVLPTVVSACAVGTDPTCLNTANEVRTTVTYGATIGDNLLPIVSASGAGDNSLLAYTVTTWNANGDPLVVDGPLPGSGDTVRYVYGVGRQRVGTIGPDPDGAGSLLHRAERLTYNGRGQVTLVEAGTTPGYNNAAWLSFQPLQQARTIHDAYGRPIVATAESTAGQRYAVTQLGYDAAGRVECAAVRMNPAAFDPLPASGCYFGPTGGFGPDRITRLGYDDAGQAVHTTHAWGLPDAIFEQVSYTDNGLPHDLTDGRGNVSRMSYDGSNRLSRIAYPDPNTGQVSATDYQESGYDAAGNVTTVRDRAGSIFDAEYDALNRLATYGPPTIAQRTMTYDLLDRPLALSDAGTPYWPVG